MDEYLNKGIKEIIGAYPEVGSILNDYDIGCGPCNVGTCLLKDIVAIHRLPEDREQELMGRIANTLSQTKDTRLAAIPRKNIG
jgi:hypothetical protein